MTAAAVSLALALVIVPRPAAARRRERLFGNTPIVRHGTRRPAVGIAVAIAAVVMMVLGIGPVIAAALVGATTVVRARKVRRDRRRATENTHLLEALEAVIGELRVGAHPGAAAGVAAEEARGVAAHAFAIGAARGRLGGSAAEGLRLPDAVVADELDRIADAWQVAEQHGLALAELLTAARTDLLGRIRFRARTDAALAGARATAAVLAGLPLLGVGLGQLMGAAPLRVLFGSGPGTILLPLGAGLICAGLLWTDAITGKALV
ncbi:hypothetical protein OG225_35845 [Nocardia sp. NBC_01377]|uniref:type II secretion system F family protein n=1 Tax=Nocardia sp. NBC_01377 TaxID=2903595 RepID=UPI0032490DE2